MSTTTPISPAQLGVRGIPSLFLFKDGQVVSNKVGAAPKAALQSWIESRDLSATPLDHASGAFGRPFAARLRARAGAAI